MSNQQKLFLSSPDGSEKKEELFHNDSVVLLGANGSGKIVSELRLKNPYRDVQEPDHVVRLSLG